MITIAFYLALITFFIPGKGKKIVGFTSIGLSLISLIMILLVRNHIFLLNAEILKPVFIFHNISPLRLLLSVKNFLNTRRSSFKQLINLQEILQIIELVLQALIAFIAINLNKLISSVQKQKQETLNSNPETKMNIEIKDDSYFDGGLLQLIGWKLLGWLITLITLGICYPWSFTMVYSWETKHTVINGKRLSFDGTALQLFGSWIKWLLLSIITLGIYGLWVPIKLKQWKIKHTSFLAPTE